MPLLLMLINFCEIMAIIFQDLPEMKRKLIAYHLKKEKQRPKLKMNKMNYIGKEVISLNKLFWEMD